MRTYWKQVAQRAFRKTLADLHMENPVSAMLGIAVIIFAAVLLYLYGSPDASRDELLSRSAWPLLALGVFPIVYVWNFIKAPPLIHGEITSRIAALEDRLIPKFTIDTDGQNAVERLPIGSSVTTAGGQRYTNIRGYDTIVRVLCRNSSLQTIDKVEAYLVGLYEVGQAGEPLDVGFRDSLKLSWSRDWKGPGDNDPAKFTRDLSSETSAYFYVLKQWGDQSVQIVTDQKALELLHIFDGVKPFLAVVQVNGGGSIPTRLNIRVTFDDTKRMQAAFAGNQPVVPVARARMLPSLEDTRPR